MSSGSPKRGSEVSSRQIRKAAMDGRRVDLYSYASPKSLITSGYVAGYDDFHWLIADDAKGKVVLIHKTAAFVVIHTQPSLDELSDEWVLSVTSAFRDRCRRDWNAVGPDPKADS